MQAQALHIPLEFNDLLDEEFDSITLMDSFSRKPVREQVTLLCDHKTWDDEFDDNDMLCELGE